MATAMSHDDNYSCNKHLHNLTQQMEPKCEPLRLEKQHSGTGVVIRSRYRITREARVNPCTHKPQGRFRL